MLFCWRQVYWAVQTQSVEQAATIETHFVAWHAKQAGAPPSAIVAREAASHVVAAAASCAPVASSEEAPSSTGPPPSTGGTDPPEDELHPVDARVTTPRR